MPEKQADQIGQRLKSITGELKLYIEKRIELLLLNIGEQLSRVMAESIQRSAGILLLSGAVVFLLVALAIYLGELLDNRSLGYVLVSLPLIVFGMLFISLKPKGMFRRIQNHFESEILKAISDNGEEILEKLQLKEPEKKSETEI